ncbi:MAG TPA: AmmeMemoRadiSam system protein A [Thermoanaerobaculia bacterium]|nr:AmmeMemoRadiSam system protein A [Thermoanaerobaculia bacterium]
MEPSRSPEPIAALDPGERRTLAGIACGAIVAAVRARAFRLPAPDGSARLAAPGASFVTLHRGGELRGCIGSIEPRRALVEDVAANARAAALEDIRFDPVVARELAELEVELSVLSPLSPLSAGSRAELLARLRPGVDGLVLEELHHRATFLPAVWEQLPEPIDFLAQLERKAGLAVGHWSTTLRFWRYAVESFPAGRALEP